MLAGGPHKEVGIPIYEVLWEGVLQIGYDGACKSSDKLLPSVGIRDGMVAGILFWTGLEDIHDGIDYEICELRKRSWRVFCFSEISDRVPFLEIPEFLDLDHRVTFCVF